MCIRDRVTRLADGKLDITVYCKKTHTDRYLHFNSHHPRHVKRGTMSCLYSRTRSITQREESLQQLRSIKAWDLNFSLISLYQLITANYMIVNIINA